MDTEIKMIIKTAVIAEDGQLLDIQKVSFTYINSALSNL